MFLELSHNAETNDFFFFFLLQILWIMMINMDQHGPRWRKNKKNNYSRTKEIILLPLQEERTKNETVRTVTSSELKKKKRLHFFYLILNRICLRVFLHTCSAHSWGEGLNWPWWWPKWAHTGAHDSICSGQVGFHRTSLHHPKQHNKSSPQSRRQWYGATLVLWNSRLLGGVCHRPDSQHQLQHTHLTGTSSAAAANTHVEHEHGAFEAWRPDLNPDLGGSWLAEDELKHLCSYVEQPRQNERPSVFSQARLGDRESLRHEGILAARFWRPARAWWRRASEEVRSAAMWFS